MIADNSQGLLQKRNSRVAYNTNSKFGDAPYFVDTQTAVGSKPFFDAVPRALPPKLMRKILLFFLNHL